SRAATTALVALTALLALLAGLLATTAPEATARASRTSLKPLLSGVVDRNGPPPAGLARVVDAYVVQVDWSQLQPRRHSFRTRVLDRALAKAHRSHSRVKLRVLTGVHSPRWAKRIGGAPVRMHDPHDDQSGTVPRFWTSAFGSAYADLQARL